MFTKTWKREHVHVGADMCWQCQKAFFKWIKNHFFSCPSQTSEDQLERLQGIFLCLPSDLWHWQCPGCINVSCRIWNQTKFEIYFSSDVNLTFIFVMRRNVIMLNDLKQTLKLMKSYTTKWNANITWSSHNTERAIWRSPVGPGHWQWTFESPLLRPLCCYWSIHFPWPGRNHWICHGPAVPRSVTVFVVLRSTSGFNWI